MAPDQNAWEALLGQLDSSSGGGDVYYLKQQKTRIRLVLPSMDPSYDGDGEDDTNFYAETTKHYQGKASAAFLVLGVVLQTSEKNDANADPTKVRAIRVAKTALRGIVAKLAEGFDLFDPEQGHSITIEKIGGKGSDRTSYDVSPSPKVVKIDPGTLTWPEKDLWTLADEESVRSAERDAKKSGEDEEGSRKRGGRNVPQTIDSDEDLPF